MFIVALYKHDPKEPRDNPRELHKTFKISVEIQRNVNKFR